MSPWDERVPAALGLVWSQARSHPQSRQLHDAMAALKKAVEGYEKLRVEWKAGNLESCGALLQQLKLTLTELTFMPTSASGVPSEQELLVARESAPVIVLRRCSCVATCRSLVLVKVPPKLCFVFGSRLSLAVPNCCRFARARRRGS